jgi:hypothetical protein
LSTRCTVHFHDDGTEEPEAIIYRHSDGYPSGVLPDIEAFFAACENGTAANGGRPDTRFNDPSYLAAKFVVYQSQSLRRHMDQFYAELAKDDAEGYYADKGSRSELDFLGTGIMAEDPMDIEYRYHLHCGGAGGAGRPRVTVDDIGGRSAMTPDEALAADGEDDD